MRISAIDQVATWLGQDHPVVRSLRDLANLAGSSSNTSTPSVVVWRPSGPAAPGVYTTSSAAWAAALAIPGDVLVQLDSTLVSTFDPVLHDCDNGRIGLTAVRRGGAVQMPDGCTVRNLASVSRTTMISLANGASPMVFDSGVQAQFDMDDGANIQGIGAVRAIRQGRPMLYVLQRGSVLDQKSLGLGAFLAQITLLTQSRLAANALDNAFPSFVLRRDASAVYQTPQGPAGVTDLMIDLSGNVFFDGSAASPVKMRTVGNAFDAIEEANGPLETRGFRALPLTQASAENVAAVGSNFEGGLFLLTRPVNARRLRLYIPNANPGARLRFALYQNDGSDLGTANNPFTLIGTALSAALPAGPVILNQLLSASGLAYQNGVILTAGIYALLWGVDSGGPVNGQVFDNGPLELGNVNVPSGRAVLTFTTPYPANAAPPALLDVSQGSADVTAATTPIAPVHTLSAS